jgi:CheY-like chemotaxis protein
MIEKTNAQSSPLYSTIADFSPRRNTNVLIIDDDVDAALLVASIFWQFGCNTAFALDTHEAQRRIIDGKADIIILDWLLGERAQADQVLAQSIKTINKYTNLRTRLSHNRAKIISYSTLKDSAILLPKSQFFEHMDHWQKPMGHNDLIHRTQNLLKHVEK